MSRIFRLNLRTLSKLLSLIAFYFFVNYNRVKISFLPNFFFIYLNSLVIIVAFIDKVKVSYKLFLKNNIARF